jgi:hypothetical protein
MSNPGDEGRYIKCGDSSSPSMEKRSVFWSRVAGKVKEKGINGEREREEQARVMTWCNQSYG